MDDAASNAVLALTNSAKALEQAVMISDELVDAKLITPAKGCFFLFIFLQIKLLLNKLYLSKKNFWISNGTYFHIFISAVKRIMMSLKKGLEKTLHIPGVKLYAQVIINYH